MGGSKVKSPGLLLLGSIILSSLLKIIKIHAFYLKKSFKMIALKPHRIQSFTDFAILNPSVFFMLMHS